MSPRVYAERLEALGISFVSIDQALQVKMNQAIFRTMEGRANDDDRKVAREAAIFSLSAAAQDQFLIKAPSEKVSLHV